MAIIVKCFLLLLSIPCIRGALRASHRIGRQNATVSTESQLRHLDDEILCRVVKIMEAEQDGTDQENFGCDPIFPEVPGTYDLPDIPHLTEQISEPLLNGDPVYLKIPGGSLSGDLVHVPYPRTVEVYRPTGRLLEKERALKPSPMKDNIAVMIRVSTRDAEPKFSAEELRRYLFQSDRPSPKQQFEDCSMHRTTLIEPDFGVLDVFVDENIADTTYRSLPNLAEAVVNTKIMPNGITNIRQYADVIMYVIPSGFGAGWAAYAVMNGKLSVYNDAWGGYMGAVMHELGHSLGIRHIYKDNKAYQGYTGYMGFQPAKVETPRRCYNAYGHFHLGWFAFHTIDVGTSVPSTSLEMVAFVDAEMLSQASEKIVIGKAGDLYWQYNLAEKFNEDTADYPNELVVFRARNDGGTDLLGGVSIGQQETFSTKSNIAMNFLACRKTIGNGSIPSSVTIMVGRDSLSCDLPEPSYAPSSAPSEKPSYFPSSMPSSLPSTRSPSFVPSLMPSGSSHPSHSSEPSFSSSPSGIYGGLSLDEVIQSTAPSVEPTPVPSLQPSTSPTSSPIGSSSPISQPPVPALINGNPYLEQVYTDLASCPYNDMSEVMDFTKPQYAAMWSLSFTLQYAGINLSQDQMLERWGLILLYLENNGRRWSGIDDWFGSVNGVETDKCTWSGITCNAQDEVIEIDLSESGVAGVVPAELCCMPALSWLDLSGNALTGNIPFCLADRIATR